MPRPPAGQAVPARRGGLRRRIGALVWIGVGCAALAYLLSLVPQDARDDARRAIAAAIAPAGAPVPRTEPDAPDLAIIVNAVKSDLAALKTGLDDLREGRDRLEQQLDTLQAAFGPITSSLPAAGTAAGAIARSHGSRPRVAVAYLPMPTDGFGDSGLDIAPLPVADVAPTRTQFGVELGVGATGTELRVRWKTLQTAHADMLSELEARQAAADDGKRLRLLAGPFGNAAQAARLCARLRAASADCRETAFEGVRLH